jgi:serine/threonine-protein kinase
MSSVYRAFDPTLERWVAIKLMHRDISNDPDQLERFRREARAVAQLNHPHVVTVIDAGEDDGAPYIVFEYVEGETLKERIRRLGRDRDRTGARGRAREPAGAPRRQATERADRLRRAREGH